MDNIILLNCATQLTVSAKEKQLGPRVGRKGMCSAFCTNSEMCHSANLLFLQNLASKMFVTDYF